jgi:polyisoprenoid-binding protein YceI
MNWKIDPAHSLIQFSVRHMMIATVRGEFERFTGVIDFNPEQPERTRVSVQIDADSINTRAADRDNHLRSPDFFDAASYPTIVFAGKRVEQTNTNRGKLVGDLTIRDVTREVVLEVEYAGLARSPWGQTSAGFSASTTINRKDWGLTWNHALETGGMLVGDTIKITIELELIRQEQETAEGVAAD